MSTPVHPVATPLSVIEYGLRLPFVNGAGGNYDGAVVRGPVVRVVDCRRGAVQLGRRRRHLGRDDRRKSRQPLHVLVQRARRSTDTLFHSVSVA